MAGRGGAKRGESPSHRAALKARRLSRPERAGIKAPRAARKYGPGASNAAKGAPEGVLLPIAKGSGVSVRHPTAVSAKGLPV
jgi:hypothetical protein